MNYVILNLYILLMMVACSPTEVEFEGCLDANADNYNPYVTLSNSSCIYSEFPDCCSIDGTGESSLIVFKDTITGLVMGDEIAVFDLSGVISTVDSGETVEYGEVMVGVVDWTGTANEEGTAETIAAIESRDLSSLDGPVLGGAVGGNEMIFKVWKVHENKVYDAIPTFIEGDGLFGATIPLHAISKLELVNP